MIAYIILTAYVISYHYANCWLPFTYLHMYYVYVCYGMEMYCVSFTTSFKLQLANCIGYFKIHVLIVIAKIIKIKPSTVLLIKMNGFISFSKKMVDE